MSEYSAVGKVINYEMNKRGATVKQLAEYLGVCPKTVRGYMTGKSVLKASNIIAISNFFNITTDYLIGLKDEFGNSLQYPPNRKNCDDNSEK